jgi:hypothetical protein
MADDASWVTLKNSSQFLTGWMDILCDIAPDSGAYMSKADLLQPNLQQAFYGANYNQLYGMRVGLFFALTAVGALDWEVQVKCPACGITIDVMSSFLLALLLYKAISK